MGDKILPKRKGQSRNDRALVIENALNWMRNSSAGMRNEDDPKSKFSRFPSIRARREALDDKESELDNIMLWMRHNKDPIDDTTDGKFKIIDDILPAKIE